MLESLYQSMPDHHIYHGNVGLFHIFIGSNLEAIWKCHKRNPKIMGLLNG